MRRPTVDDVLLARVFLLVLVAVGGYCFCLPRPAATISLPPCPCYQLTQVPCPGCGMTRACMRLVQGDLTGAWCHHPFSLVVVGLAIGVAVVPTWLRSVWQQLPWWLRNTVVAAAFVLLLGHWLWRLTG